MSPTLNGMVLRTGSGGGPTPVIPDGYEEFLLTDGAFAVKEGKFYVKQLNVK